MSNPHFPIDTGLYYPLSDPFSFIHGDEYDFDATSSVSPEMSRYLKSPTPGSGEAQADPAAGHQQHVPDQYHSPTSFNMGSLTLQSPTGAVQPTQPIPINQTHQPPTMYTHPSSYPDIGQRHIYYHPYNRPENHLRSPSRAISMQATPPGSSHSATSAPLSSALVSPMSDLTGMSPLHLHLNAGYQHAATPYIGAGGTETEPRGVLAGHTGTPMGLGLGGPGTGIGVGGTGFHYVSAAQIPQYPPERRSGRPKGGRSKGSVSKVKKIKMEGEESVRVKREDGVDRDREDDEDAEGESVIDNVTGTHKSQLEKRRRSALKQHFDTLGGLLPITGGGKGTKAATLDRATSYIQELRMSLNSVIAQHEADKHALAEERRAHAETQRLNAELSRALAAVRTGSASGSGSPPSWPVVPPM